MSSQKWCDRQRRQSFYMLQKYCELHVALNGIAVFQIVIDKSKNRPSMLALLPIDPSRLVTPMEYTMNKERVYDGIRVDDAGMPESVYILKDMNYGATVDNCDHIPIWNELNGFQNILLVTEVENTAEYRKDSILGPMIPTLRDSYDSFTAAIAQRIIHSQIALFLEQQQQANIAQYQSNALKEWKERGHSLPFGIMWEGVPGEKPHLMQSDAPGANFGEMHTKIDGKLGAGTMRGPELLRHEYKASYSASRMSRINSHMINEQARGRHNICFNQPIIDWFIYLDGIAGNIPGISAQKVKDLISSGHFIALSQCEYLPPPMYAVDENKEANAENKKLNSGTDTIPAIYSRKNRDFRAAMEEEYMVEAEHKRLEDKYRFVLPKRQSPVVPESNATENDMDNDEDSDN